MFWAVTAVLTRPTLTTYRDFYQRHGAARAEATREAAIAAAQAWNWLLWQCAVLAVVIAVVLYCATGMMAGSDRARITVMVLLAVAVVSEVDRWAGGRLLAQPLPMQRGFDLIVLATVVAQVAFLVLCLLRPSRRFFVSA